MTYTVGFGELPGRRPLRGHRRASPARLMNAARRRYRPLAQQEGLGFSLKPPKKVRKFIAKHKTALLVGAGVLTAGILAPGAALAAGRGLLAAGKFAVGEAKRLPGLFHRAAPTPSTTTPPVDMGPAPQPAPAMPTLTLPTSPPTVATDSGGGGTPSMSYGGGGTPDTSGDEPGTIRASTPGKPGINPALAIGGGLAALFLLPQLTRRR